MKHLLAATAASLFLAFGVAHAETVLRTDEGGIGELDPHKASDLADSILLYNVYDTLVFPAVDQGSNEYRPHLAEKIDIDSAGTTYTVTLKPNVKFHSGNVLEAEDVVFSMNRMLALNKGFSYLFRGWVNSIAAKDARTVVITLTKPYTAFYVSLTRLGIVDRKTVIAKKEAGNYGEFGDYGEKFLNTNDAGTGAYRIDYHKADELSVMKKTTTYFGFINKAAPDTARMAYVIKEPTLLTLMSRGEHDIVNTFVTPETKMALSKIKGITLLREPG
ncbi:MAG: ABC transporter substrate-binding protein, partial [Rhodospirillales bacterium]|nr:ABC transporter substrate-binding protein [Rhodospirillales bacterium]